LSFQEKRALLYWQWDLFCPRAKKGTVSFIGSERTNLAPDFLGQKHIHFSRCVSFGILDDGQVQKPGNPKHDVVMFHVLVFAGPLLDGSILVCGPSQLETYFYVCGPSVLCVLVAKLLLPWSTFWWFCTVAILFFSSICKAWFGGSICFPRLFRTFHYFEPTASGA